MIYHFPFVDVMKRAVKVSQFHFGQISIDVMIHFITKLRFREVAHQHCEYGGPRTSVIKEDVCILGKNRIADFDCASL